MTWLEIILLATNGGLFYLLADTKIKYLELKQQLKSKTTIAKIAADVAVSTGVPYHEAVQGMVQVMNSEFSRSRNKRLRFRR